MAQNRSFIETIQKWEGMEVDVFLKSGQKLDNVFLSIVDQEKIIAEAERVKYLFRPENIDYLKKA